MACETNARRGALAAARCGVSRLASKAAYAAGVAGQRLGKPALVALNLGAAQQSDRLARKYRAAGNVPVSLALKSIGAAHRMAAGALAVNYIAAKVNDARRRRAATRLMPVEAYFHSPAHKRRTLTAMLERGDWDGGGRFLRVPGGSIYDPARTAIYSPSEVNFFAGQDAQPRRTTISSQDWAARFRPVGPDGSSFRPYSPTELPTGPPQDRLWTLLWEKETNKPVITAGFQPGGDGYYVTEHTWATPNWRVEIAEADDD